MKRNQVEQLVLWAVLAVAAIVLFLVRWYPLECEP